MADKQDKTEDEKEIKRKKQKKRMTKILAKAWELTEGHANLEIFQEHPNLTSAPGAVFDLSSIGEYLDQTPCYYKLGRTGWERFAKDIGGVYNHHIWTKEKQTIVTAAKTHRKEAQRLLAKIDENIGRLVMEHLPEETSSSSAGGTKRKHSNSNGGNSDESSMVGGPSPMKKGKSEKRTSTSSTSSVGKRFPPKHSQDMAVPEREEKAMVDLRNYIEANGGKKSLVAGFSPRVCKRSDGKYDINFKDAGGKRYRSMIEVARFFGLVHDKKTSRQTSSSSVPSSGNNHLPKRSSEFSVKMGKPASSKQMETERRQLRREMDRLTKAHHRAVKALDDLRNDQSEGHYPVEDDLLMEENEKKVSKAMALMTCPAAHVPDMDGFHGIPQHCVPDVLTVWDFLCTFTRALSLNPVSLKEFVSALTYKPTLSQDGSNVHEQPPVYLAEAHLGLIKLLLQDPVSDEWWWSILETPSADGGGEEDEAAGGASLMNSKIPVIKIDMASLLAQEEDGLITASWVQALDDVRNHRTNLGAPIREAIRAAMNVAANRYVKAYLQASLKKWKRNAAGFPKRAAIWLVDRIREARPDLWGRNVKREEVYARRAKVVDECAHWMEKVDPNNCVVVDDVDEQLDEEEEEDSDSEDEGDHQLSNVGSKKGEDHIDPMLLPVTTSIPEKPQPTLVDFLLPPSKPFAASDLVTSLTWPSLVGASVCRILHFYKRLRNDVDDALRDCRGLPALTVGERKRREALSSCRVLSECTVPMNGKHPAETSVEHLCQGGHYLSLSVIERLCVLKVLVDAAYDSNRVHEVVDGNHKARVSATKALETEERRAKKEAKEEAAAADAAAREKLAKDRRETFIEEQREEIRKLNRRSREYSDEFIDNLTDEDILEFDEYMKEQYEALPQPTSFNKTEVNKMVKQMQEEAAFDTHALRVVTPEDLPDLDKQELESMEQHVASYDGVDLYSLRREESRRLDRMKKDIASIHENSHMLPAVRQSAIDVLTDAIEDGTVKSLKSAIRTAKNAKLMGTDLQTQGVWALDLVRDAALELKVAESRKRIVEAQKDLIAKRNKCFIRSEPIGQDRFRNNFWHFEADPSAFVWAEANYVFNHSKLQALPANDSFVPLLMNATDAAKGPEDMEDDFIQDIHDDGAEKSQRLRFCRQEYHPQGLIASICERHWGCHMTDGALKKLVKSLDDRGVRERELKRTLKETIEESEKKEDDYGDDAEGTGTEGKVATDDDQDSSNEQEDAIEKSGDQHYLANAKEAMPQDSSFISASIASLTTAISSKVRIRDVVNQAKDGHETAMYNNGTVLGWTLREEEREEAYTVMVDGDAENEFRTVIVKVPVWKVLLDHGEGDAWLSGKSLIESLRRYELWASKEPSYTENDASFLAYRNSLGRHCGKAADAGISATPIFLGRTMVRREQELYTPLKSVSYDNSWGGKSGNRNAWINSMKEYCYDIPSARAGLLTLEEALFELTGGFANASSPVGEDSEDQNETITKSAAEILADPALRVDIELESIDMKAETSALWNSKESRSIFRYIVGGSKTTGFLALALDLLCRNCHAYIEANKPKNNRASNRSSRNMVENLNAYAPPPMRMTRRMNAWQQANDDYY